MAQKPVSFKVAKALKEAGYPQGNKGYRYTTKKCRGRYVDSPGNNNWYEFDEGELVDGNMYHLFQSSSVYAPTYLDVWLWLWREKKTHIEVVNMIYKIYDAAEWVDNYGHHLIKLSNDTFNDPEEAIAKAIDYLVENKLIK